MAFIVSFTVGKENSELAGFYPSTLEVTSFYADHKTMPLPHPFCNKYPKPNKAKFDVFRVRLNQQKIYLVAILMVGPVI